jgi:hypothetical protein
LPRTPSPFNFARTDNLGDFLRAFGTLQPIKGRSLTVLNEKLIRIGETMASHGCYTASWTAKLSLRWASSPRSCG